MTWTAFDTTLPVASDTGADVVNDINANENALLVWQIVNTGGIPGYAVTTNSNGTSIPDDQPTEIYFRRGAMNTTGSVWIRVSLVWGTTGGADGNVTQMTFAFSDNGGGAGGTTYDKMTMHGNDRATFTYTANGDPSPSNFIAWSLS